MGRHAQGWRFRWRGGWAHVRFTLNGKEYERATGSRDPGEAAKRAAEIYARAVSGRVDLEVRRVDPFAALDVLVSEWISDFEKTNPKTAPTYFGYAKGWIAFFKTFDRITRSSIGDWTRERLTKVIKKTVSKERGALRGFLEWCVEKGALDVVPPFPKIKRSTTGTRSGKQRSVPVDLDPAQVAAFLAALPEWAERHGTHLYPVRDRFIVAYETGLRPATLDALRTPTHFTGGSILEISDEIDKVRFGRKVPLTPAAREALRRCAPDVGLIFGRHDYRGPVAAACKRAGLPPGIAPYDLRHARATGLLEAGGSLPGVAYLLGHRQVTTTNRYVRPGQRAAERTLAMAGNSREDEVRRKGLEPLQELPHWNLNPPGDDLTARKHSDAVVPEESGNADLGPDSRECPELMRTARGLGLQLAIWDAFDAFEYEESGT